MTASPQVGQVELWILLSCCSLLRLALKEGTQKSNFRYWGHWSSLCASTWVWFWHHVLDHQTRSRIWGWQFPLSRSFTRRGQFPLSSSRTDRASQRLGWLLLTALSTIQSHAGGQTLDKARPWAGWWFLRRRWDQDCWWISNKTQWWTGRRNWRCFRLLQFFLLATWQDSFVLERDAYKRQRLTEDKINTDTSSVR